jgi:Protein of unknown function (DUF2971)
MKATFTDEQQAALKRYQEFWPKRAKEESARSVPREPLYHYSGGLDGLRGILANETLRFSDIRYLNDEVELTYGLRLFRKLIRRAEHEPASRMARLFLRRLRKGKFRERLFDQFHFYSASFGVRDEPGMWRNYARGGRGFAISFSPDLFRDDADLETLAPNMRYFTGKVEYGDVEALRLHREALEAAMSVIPEIDDDEVAWYFLGALSAEMHVPVVWTSLRTKEPKWSHENETRLVAIQDQSRGDKLKARRPKRPFFEMKFPKTSVVEVMFGPKVESSMRDQVQEFLVEHKYECLMTKSTKGI